MNNDNKFQKYFYPDVMEKLPAKNDLYCDLPRHLNEMLKGISDEKDKEKIIRNINTYYDSLNTLLIKHSLKHPCMSIS